MQAAAELVGIPGPEGMVRLSLLAVLQLTQLLGLAAVAAAGAGHLEVLPAAITAAAAAA
jgi:hypothetical protein